jgi:hypothetical protein
MTERVLKTLEASTFYGSHLGEARLAEPAASVVDVTTRLRQLF